MNRTLPLTMTMYEKIKQLVRKIIPARIIRRHESFLRSIIALKYRGNTYQCNICDYRLSGFIALSNKEKLCPKCGSLPRTRRLWHLLVNEIGLDCKKVLHFSPPAALAKKLARSNVSEYVTSDYMGEFKADKHLDITQISEPDNSYDLIICYHVLEHIEEDQKAMKELYRILKDEGICVIQTPFHAESIYEDPAIVAPEDRLVHFGQEDHVRIYSVEGLCDRLKAAQFEVTSRRFDSDDDNLWGFSKEEQMIIVKKNRHS